MAVIDLSKVFPKSEYIKSFEWTGDVQLYPDKDVKGDTYPMTWGADDKIYTSAGDPCYGYSNSGLDFNVIEGDPENYVIKQLNCVPEQTGWGSNGPKPTGIISVNGVIYLFVQNCRRAEIPPFRRNSQSGNDGHIFYTNDKLGWSLIPHIDNIVNNVHFPGHKFGGASFIQYGKDNANARDEYVYAVSGDQWDKGCNVRLGRVPNNKIQHRECWEFMAGWYPDATPVWHHDLEESIPLMSAEGLFGTPEMVYIKSINRYLFLTWTLHEDFSGTAGTDLLILEAPEPWGPFSIVYQEEYWNGQEFNPYCPRIPLKWMAEDGLSGWIQCSGSWVKQDPYYRYSVRTFKIELY